MADLYLSLTHEEYQSLGRQMKAFDEDISSSPTGFFQRSIRLRVTPALMLTFHGPLVKEESEANAVSKQQIGFHG